MLSREQLRHLPREPGVYLYRAPDGTLLYVGKAKDLRRRVQSYFRGGRQPRRIARLVRQVASVEVIPTLTEEEALTHEAHLIRQHKPPFNIGGKLERPDLYLKLTTEEAFPRLEVAREIQDDGGTYFGPYSSSFGLFLIKDTVDRHFRLRKLPVPIGERPRKPCWNYHLGRCEAPCAGLIGPERYSELVGEAAQFLRGEHEPLFQTLRERMLVASERLEYEWAAQLRDQMRALERLFRRQQATGPEPFDADVAAGFCDSGAACLVLLVFRRSRLLGQQRLDLDELEPEELDEALESFLKQHYASGAEIPAQVLVDRPLRERPALKRWLSSLAGRRVRLRHPRDRRELRWMQMARRGVELGLRARLAQAGPTRLLERLRSSLLLHTRPDRIEGIDASHFQGEDMVASLVVCLDGRMDRSRYRHYRIQGLDRPDDFAAVAQVVARRLDRLLAEGGRLPDLLLIDGGEGQLAAALAEVRERGLEGRLDVAAIAKARPRAEDPRQRVDRVYRPGRPEPFELREEPSAMQLLQRIRDEAHRFALTYQRRLRGRRIERSELDAVPGLGRIRKRELLRALGSVARVAAASAKELEHVPGIDRKTAARIFEHFSQRRAIRAAARSASGPGPSEESRLSGR
jgi:excinuclease ABC subunit C